MPLVVTTVISDITKLLVVGYTMYTVYTIQYGGIQPHFSTGKNRVGPPRYTLYSIHDVVGYTMYNEQNAMYFV